MSDVRAMRWARGSAWLLWAVTLVVAAAGLALLAWDWSAPVPAGLFGIRGFDGVFAVCFGGMGALLTSRHPGHPVDGRAAPVSRSGVAVRPRPVRDQGLHFPRSALVVQPGQRRLGRDREASGRRGPPHPG